MKGFDEVKIGIISEPLRNLRFFLSTAAGA
jgi:hypothetical protein